VSIELVNVQTSDGVRLDGSLCHPEGASRLGIDAAILLHGVGGNFYNPSFFAQLQEELASAGCAAFRVNNRGHDMVYNARGRRLGAAFEMLDDSRLDWRAWIDEVASRGYRRVLVWGHSLGAVKTAYYAANEKDERLVCAIASSPPRFSYKATFSQEGGELFRGEVERAQRLLDGGRAEELISVTIPTTSLFSARTYVDKYGPQERFNVLDHLPRTTVPMLVTVGSLEGVGPQQADWFAFGGLHDQLTELTQANPRLSYELVDGADHGYTDRIDVLWRLARDWLSKAVDPAAVA
jgi:pimeloyl-ACP methyl ester carboxylesterase